MKLSTTSRVWSPMVMCGVSLTSWPMMLVFFRLMVKSNSLQASEKRFMSRCSASFVWAVRAASSANNISLMRTHLGLGSETGQVEEVPVAPGVEEDAIFRLAEGVAQEQREEHAKKCRGQDTSLLHTVLDREGVRGCSVELDCAIHVIMERCDHLEEFWGTSNLSKRAKRPVLLTRSKALVRSMKARYSGRLCSRHFS